MGNDNSKILRIHPEYQPEEKLPPAQFNLFTGKAEPIPQLIDKNIDDERFIDDGISLAQSGDSSQIVLSGFGIFLSKKSERLLVKKSDKVIYEFPYAMLSSPMLSATVMSRREQIMALNDKRGLEFSKAVVEGKRRNQKYVRQYPKHDTLPANSSACKISG